MEESFLDRPLSKLLSCVASLPTSKSVTPEAWFPNVKTFHQSVDKQTRAGRRVHDPRTVEWEQRRPDHASDAVPTKLLAQVARREVRDLVRRTRNCAQIHATRHEGELCLGRTQARSWREATLNRSLWQEEGDLPAPVESHAYVEIRCTTVGVAVLHSARSTPEDV